MVRLILLITLTLAAGCAQLHPSSDPQAPNKCYTESGWLDSSNSCSAREGYPDCYLICPAQGTRKKL